MTRETSKSIVTGRGARRLAGAVSLLLAVCLVAAGITPALHASSPPPMPHQFYGTVSFGGALVDEDTLVEAFVGGVKEAQTTVDAEGRYGDDPAFMVPGTAGAVVTFRIGGVLANETSTWQSGRIQELNLTVDEEPEPPVPKYALTTAASPEAGGNATDETDKSPYVEGFEVSLRALASPGYRFVNWTASAGVFGNATEEATTFTMPAQNITVTANFQAVYNLTMAEDPAAGGQAVDVDGKGAYPQGTVVSIKAEPAAGYGFSGWTAPAGAFEDDTAAETTFTMPAQNVTVTAGFEIVFNLTMAEDPAAGGEAVDVDGKGAYAQNATVTIRAEPAQGYGFVNWTSEPEGIIDDEDALETFLTMPGEHAAVTANFEVVEIVVGTPTVTTEVATGVTTHSANLNVSFTVGNSDSVELRFAVRRPAYDPSWFHTPTWELREADGAYSYALTGLSPGHDYDVKAQLKYNDTVIEGAVVQFSTIQQPGAGVGFDLSRFGCFIATAAYGTPAAEQIDVLRDFRDDVLLGSALGSRFVALYYRLSPPVANFIAENGLLRTVVREILVEPVVWIVRATSGMWRR